MRPLVNFRNVVPDVDRITGGNMIDYGFKQHICEALFGLAKHVD